MARLTTVKTLPRIVGVAGGETKEGELKDNTGAKTRKTKVKTHPQATIVAGGGRDKRRKPTQNGKVAQPTVPRGGEAPSRKYTSKEKTKQRVSHRKGDKTYSPGLLCE